MFRRAFLIQTSCEVTNWQCLPQFVQAIRDAGPRLDANDSYVGKPLTLWLETVATNPAFDIEKTNCNLNANGHGAMVKAMLNMIRLRYACDTVLQIMSSWCSVYGG